MAEERKPLLLVSERSTILRRYGVCSSRDW